MQPCQVEDTPDVDGSPDHPDPHPEIPYPGLPTFLPALLSYIRHAASVNASTSAGSHGHNTVNSNPLPLDSAVLQSILLCLVANKHLILRTSDDDIPNVVKLAALTLSFVFAYHPIHRLKIRPKGAHNKSSDTASSSRNPDAFLRSVFLPSTRRATDAASSNNETPINRVDSSLHSRLRPSQSGSAYTSLDEASVSTQTTIHPDRNSRHRKHRSASSSRSYNNSSIHHTKPSYSSEFAINANSGANSSIHSALHGDNQDFSPLSHSPPPSVRQISFASSSPSYKRTPPPQPLHAYSDPTPFPSHRVLSAQPEEKPIVPKGIVISGLEHASSLSQRALVRVLTERRLILDRDEDSDTEVIPNEDTSGLDGVWNLPEDFILLYVCAHDDHERPGIHHSLLDKFAMSTNITLQPATRNAIRSYRSSHGASGQAYRSSPSLASIPLPILSPRPTYPGAHTAVGLQSTHTHSQTSNPIRPPLTPLLRPSSTPFLLDSEPPPVGLLPTTLLPSLRAMYTSPTQIQISPQLLLYAADLFSAVRHHPQLDGTLLTARAHRDALDLTRAARLLGIDLTGMEIIRVLGVNMDEETSIQQLRRRGISNGTTEGTTTEYGEGMSDVYSGISSGIGLLSPFGDGDGNIRISDDRPSIASQPGMNLRDADSDLEVLDVSEADIARIVPRVVTHRLRVRDGPEDEVLASTIFGAVAARLASTERSRNTIKDILISILAEV